MLLIRHAHTAAVGRRLTGRLQGVELTPEGRRQAQALAAQLAPVPLAAIYSSPLERAIETARPVAEKCGLEIVACDGLNEIDFGEWTGLAFDTLDTLPEWRRFNIARSRVRVPGGEHPVAVQRRAVEAVEHLGRPAPRRDHRRRHVTHADIIRSILAHDRRLPLDRIHDLDIPPASVTPLVRGTVPLGSPSPVRAFCGTLLNLRTRR